MESFSLEGKGVVALLGAALMSFIIGMEINNMEMKAQQFDDVLVICTLCEKLIKHESWRKNTGRVLDPIKFRVNFSQDPCIRVVFHNSLHRFSFL